MLYKYLGSKEINGQKVARADFILNQLFRYTQPNLLNDPYEVRPRLFINSYSQEDYAAARKQAQNERLTNLTDRQIENLFLKPFPSTRYSEKTHPGLIPCTIPEYRSEPFHSLEEIDNFCANKAIEEFLDSVNKSYGIFSLTTRKNNMLMWSHYADSHHGIVVGFDENHHFFSGNTFPVEYSHERITISSNHGVLRVHGEHFENIPHKPLATFLRKHPDWKYEDEFRSIRKLENCSKRIEENYLFKIPYSAINEIILGAQIKNAEDIVDTINMNQNWNHVDILQAKLSELNFDLEFLNIRPARRQD